MVMGLDAEAWETNPINYSIPSIFTVKCDQRFLHIIAVTWSVSIICFDLDLVGLITQSTGLLLKSGPRVYSQLN